MTCWRHRFHVPLDAVEPLLQGFNSLGLRNVGWWEDEASSPSNQIDETGLPIASWFFVEGYTQNDLDDAALRHFKLMASLWGDVGYEKTIVDMDTDIPFLTHTHTVGPFLIGPSIHQTPFTKIPLFIERATAFGSGEHPTTQGCLLMLDRLARAYSFKEIVDVGCGSGVLSLAASHLWPQAHIFASDCDPESVRVTRHHAHLNRCSLEVYESLGLSSQKLHRSYDLIIANILARPLRHLAHSFGKHLRPKGILILSGFLKSQENLVLSAYRHQNIRLKYLYNQKNWMTVCLELE